MKPARNPRGSGKTPASVLVFCLAGIGDALLATPGIRALKRAWPDARLTALTMFAGARSLMSLQDEIDEALLFDFMHAPAWRALRYVWELRGKYDAVMLTYPSNRLEYNVMAWLTGARMRAGHRYARMDLVCGNWLNTKTVRENDVRTNIEENLLLAERITGVPAEDAEVRLAVPRDAQREADAWLTGHGLAGSLLVGFHAGGSTAKNHVHKRWPAEQYAELARIVTDRCGAAVLLFGGPEEAALKQRIAENTGGAAVAVDSVGFEPMLGLIGRCAHFVANDTALLHLAGALRVPATAVFGPTHADWVRIPGAKRHEVALGLPCQPCFSYSPTHLACESGGFRCLTELDVEAVAAPVMAVLSGRSNDQSREAAADGT